MFWGTLAPCDPTHRGVCTAFTTSLTGAQFRVIYQEGKKQTVSRSSDRYLVTWSVCNTQPWSQTGKFCNTIRLIDHTKAKFSLPNVFLPSLASMPTNTSIASRKSAYHVNRNIVLSSSDSWIPSGAGVKRQAAPDVFFTFQKHRIVTRRTHQLPWSNSTFTKRNLQFSPTPQK